MGTMSCFVIATSGFQSAPTANRGIAHVGSLKHAINDGLLSPLESKGGEPSGRLSLRLYPAPHEWGLNVGERSCCFVTEVTDPNHPITQYLSPG